METLNLTHVHTAPWGQALLHDINLNLGSGQILGIIGPNGAGKTSLLQTMAGDVQLTQGSIALLDTALEEWSLNEKAKHLSVLPQQSSLNFPYTVEEVVMLGRSPHGTGSAADTAIVTEVMIATDTLELGERLYTQLSGGEKQRVQLARVFAQIWPTDEDRQRLLLLDEPTTALDLKHQQLITKTIKELASKGCAVVMITHDFNLLTATADQILALRDGRQVALGTPEEVLTREIFAQVFEVEITVGKHPDNRRPLVINI